MKISAIQATVTLFLLVKSVESRGVLTVKLLQFDNPEGRTVDGGCCDQTRAKRKGVCIGKCDYVMRLTVSGLSRGNDHVFLFHKPIRNDTNSIIFGDKHNGTTLTILFDEWPGYVTMNVFFFDYNVYDDSTVLVDWFDTELYKTNEKSKYERLEIRGERKEKKTKLLFEWSTYCYGWAHCPKKAKPQRSKPNPTPESTTDPLSLKNGDEQIDGIPEIDGNFDITDAAAAQPQLAHKKKNKIPFLIRNPYEMYRPDNSKIKKLRPRNLNPNSENISKNGQFRHDNRLVNLPGTAIVSSVVGESFHVNTKEDLLNNFHSPERENYHPNVMISESPDSLRTGKHHSSTTDHYAENTEELSKSLTLETHERHKPVLSPFRTNAKNILTPNVKDELEKSGNKDVLGGNKSINRGPADEPKNSNANTRKNWRSITPTRRNATPDYTSRLRSFGSSHRQNLKQSNKSVPTQRTGYKVKTRKDIGLYTPSNKLMYNPNKYYSNIQLHSKNKIMRPTKKKNTTKQYTSPIHATIYNDSNIHVPNINRHTSPKVSTKEIFIPNVWAEEFRKALNVSKHKIETTYVTSPQRNYESLDRRISKPRTIKKQYNDVGRTGTPTPLFGSTLLQDLKVSSRSFEPFHGVISRESDRLPTTRKIGAKVINTDPRTIIGQTFQQTTDTLYPLYSGKTRYSPNAVETINNSSERNLSLKNDKEKISEKSNVNAGKPRKVISNKPIAISTIMEKTPEMFIASGQKNKSRTTIPLTMIHNNHQPMETISEKIQNAKFTTPPILSTGVTAAVRNGDLKQQKYDSIYIENVRPTVRNVQLHKKTETINMSMETKYGKQSNRDTQFKDMRPLTGPNRKPTVNNSHQKLHKWISRQQGHDDTSYFDVGRRGASEKTSEKEKEKRYNNTPTHSQKVYTQGRFIKNERSTISTNNNKEELNLNSPNKMKNNRDSFTSAKVITEIGPAISSVTHTTSTPPRKAQMNETKMFKSQENRRPTHTRYPTRYPLHNSTAGYNQKYSQNNHEAYEQKADLNNTRQPQVYTKDTALTSGIESILKTFFADFSLSAAASADKHLHKKAFSRDLPKPGINQNSRGYTNQTKHKIETRFRGFTIRRMPTPTHKQRHVPDRTTMSTIGPVTSAQEKQRPLTINDDGTLEKNEQIRKGDTKTRMSETANRLSNTTKHKTTVSDHFISQVAADRYTKPNKLSFGNTQSNFKIINGSTKQRGLIEPRENITLRITKQKSKTNERLASMSTLRMQDTPKKSHTVSQSFKTSAREKINNRVLTQGSKEPLTSLTTFKRHGTSSLETLRETSTFIGNSYTTTPSMSHSRRATFAFQHLLSLLMGPTNTTTSSTVSIQTVSSLDNNSSTHKRFIEQSGADKVSFLHLKSQRTGKLTKSSRAFSMNPEPTKATRTIHATPKLHTTSQHSVGASSNKTGTQHIVLLSTNVSGKDEVLQTTSLSTLENSTHGRIIKNSSHRNTSSTQDHQTPHAVNTKQTTTIRTSTQLNSTQPETKFSNSLVKSGTTNMTHILSRLNLTSVVADRFAIGFITSTPSTVSLAPKSSTFESTSVKTMAKVAATKRPKRYTTRLGIVTVPDIKLFVPPTSYQVNPRILKTDDELPEKPLLKVSQIRDTVVQNHIDDVMKDIKIVDDYELEEFDEWPSSSGYKSSDFELEKMFNKYWPAILGSTVGAVFLSAAILTSITCRRRILIRRMSPGDSPEHLQEPPDVADFSSCSGRSSSASVATVESGMNASGGEHQ